MDLALSRLQQYLHRATGVLRAGRSLFEAEANRGRRKPRVKRPAPRAVSSPAPYSRNQETPGLDDEAFVRRISEKIERLSGRQVELRIDEQEASQLQLELKREIPLVVLGTNVIRYAGFARMCIEYAAASIQEQRPIDMLEFHLLLARN